MKLSPQLSYTARLILIPLAFFLTAPVFALIFPCLAPLPLIPAAWFHLSSRRVRCPKCSRRIVDFPHSNFGFQQHRNPLIAPPLCPFCHTDLRLPPR